MNSCELAATVTAIACAIAKCVSKEELNILIAVFGQLSSTLGTILIQEEANSSMKEEKEKVPPGIL